ncbi:unnamed protein product [Gongylonema pulchrum]|uniref:Pinin_SDK_memA domain-containing protein n=1 Tax=Gongylonema pulchrum TaxID=637853 RepID=A0A183D0R0_9BILA|nr:unnamed protein product [Gongylonema pulchrum]
MFSNLLLGTLQRFQMDEKKIATVEKVQAEKQKEVEKRLREEEEQEREKLARERAALLEKRREKARLIKMLQRKRAIIQYAQQKQEHYRKLQNFIQTKAKPPIFYLPAKHTLRTLELLKTTVKKIDELIEHRQLQMEEDLGSSETKQAEEVESDNEEHPEFAKVRSSVTVTGSATANADDEKPVIVANEMGEGIAEVSSMQPSDLDGHENGEEPKELECDDEEEETGKDTSRSDSELDS